MQKPTRVTKFSLGSQPTVDSFLEVASWLKQNFDRTARVEFSKEFGQRDAEYTFITITETNW